MDGVIQDIKFSFRMLRKSPGATAVALLSLTLGLSVNTTVFSWVRSVLLNPLHQSRRGSVRRRAVHKGE